jgi:cation diffusion facilitator family transporter
VNSIPGKRLPDIKKGLRSTLMGVGVNMALAVVKVVAGVVGHSFALIADGVESTGDVVSGLAVVWGLRIAVRPPDEDHPYGHGKAEPMAAVVVGLFLVAAALLIGAESIKLIRVPHELPAPFTLAVLVGVLAIKLSLSRYVGGIATELESTAVKADAWHHLSDALTSGFAFIGISVALIGGKGWEAADDWAALAGSCVILFNAWRQMKPAVLELSDASPDPSIEKKARTLACSIPGVLGTEKCFVRKVGFSFYIDLHVVVDGKMTVREGHAIAHAVKDQLLIDIPQVAEVLIHIEPEEELTMSTKCN